MIVIELATELGRFRGLKDRESRWLEASVRREDRRNGHIRPLWRTKDDLSLKRMVKQGKKPRAIAEALGRTEGAVWSRIRFLRRRGKIGYFAPSHPRAFLLQGPIATAIAAE